MRKALKDKEIHAYLDVYVRITLLQNFSADNGGTVVYGRRPGSQS